MPVSIPQNGYVDIQVNGYLGIDFSSPELTKNEVLRVSEALEEEGTVAFCPTIITSPPEVYERNLPLLASAMDANTSGADILGIHLEGPFLAPESCGAHPEAFLRPPKYDLFERWQDLADGNIILFTLAPELLGSIRCIKKIAGTGVKVALGHHMGTQEDVQRAAEAGASLCTHLGNGIANTLPRHPNPLWSQLACDSMSASLITDGHHLPREFVVCAIRAKGVDNCIVTADRAPIAGLSPGKYEWGGQEVILDEHGKIALAHKDALAGSAATMRHCVEQLAEWGILEYEDLQRVSRENALNILGIKDKYAAE